MASSNATNATDIRLILCSSMMRMRNKDRNKTQNSINMNIAVIFAGGSGLRMHTKSRPKQFLDLNGKPIIIYTLELFDNHQQIDAIIVSCIKEWIPFLEKMLRKFEINKVVKIVPGGKSGQESIYKGLCAAEEYAQSQNINNENTTVLIHDGVRPLSQRRRLRITSRK